MHAGQPSDDFWGGLDLLTGLRDARAREQALRRHLAGLLGCAPGDVVLTRDDRGKPYLAAPASPLAFSTSHRLDLLLVATAWDRPVGADLELMPPVQGYMDVARDFFTPAESGWLGTLSGSDRDAGFLRLWTAKEAVLKAMGRGILQGMREPDLSPLLEPGRPLALDRAVVETSDGPFAVSWRRLDTAHGTALAARAVGAA